MKQGSQSLSCSNLLQSDRKNDELPLRFETFRTGGANGTNDPISIEVRRGTWPIKVPLEFLQAVVTFRA